MLDDAPDRPTPTPIPPPHPAPVLEAPAEQLHAAELAMLKEHLAVLTRDLHAQIAALGPGWTPPNPAPPAPRGN